MTEKDVKIEDQKQNTTQILMLCSYSKLSRIHLRFI